MYRNLLFCRTCRCRVCPRCDLTVCRHLTLYRSMTLCRIGRRYIPHVPPPSPPPPFDAEPPRDVDQRPRTVTRFGREANGMVERLHRQLKAALRAAAPARWTEALPLALLGIRSALKQDLGCSTAELVYGAPLRLPGELITPSATAPPTPESFAAELQRTMAALRPTAPRPAPSAPSYVPRALDHASHVFVRHDACRL
ncbi:uncharacterized protein LOC122386994 [Amphibalanus amphitrite]|uniref:uncharacterized protein LOC122386994 n=1 Tax=Amphibalanus amphitrite TaxID=1232801 RepID=UPI001C8FA7DF|nr:uncharacterized protein LOC122386994 [Amphibalanus amphitrite]